jgi:hypothetical protein
MNEDRLKGKWNQIKGELKKKWGKLTDDDLMYGEGHIEQDDGPHPGTDWREEGGNPEVLRSLHG